MRIQCQETLREGVKTHSTQAERNPEGRKRQADLTVEVQGQIPIIPNLIVPVGKESGQ